MPEIGLEAGEALASAGPGVLDVAGGAAQSAAGIGDLVTGLGGAAAGGSGFLADKLAASGGDAFGAGAKDLSEAAGGVTGAAAGSVPGGQTGIGLSDLAGGTFASGGADALGSAAGNINNVFGDLGQAYNAGTMIPGDPSGLGAGAPAFSGPQAAPGVASFGSGDPTAFATGASGPAVTPTAAPSAVGATGAPGATSDLSALAGSGQTAAEGAAGVADKAKPSLLEKLGTGAMNSLTNNPLGAAISAGGLGYSLLKGQQTDPNVAALSASAPGLAQQGQQLGSYLTSGTLPPGMQAQVDQATKSAKAAKISAYASQGMNTDPNKNTVLAQDLAAIDQQAVALAGQLQNQLLTTGLKETDMSNQLYQTLAGLNKQQAASTGAAIANFASALAGKSNTSGKAGSFTFTPGG